MLMGSQRPRRWQPRTLAVLAADHQGLSSAPGGCVHRTKGTDLVPAARLYALHSDSDGQSILAGLCQQQLLSSLLLEGRALCYLSAWRVEPSALPRCFFQSHRLTPDGDNSFRPLGRLCAGSSAELLF